MVHAKQNFDKTLKSTKSPATIIMEIPIYYVAILCHDLLLKHLFIITKLFPFI